MPRTFQFELQPLNSIPGLADQIPPYEALDLPVYPPELQNFENEMDDLRAAEEILKQNSTQTEGEIKEDFREDLQNLKQKLDKVKNKYAQFIQENIKHR